MDYDFFKTYTAPTRTPRQIAGRVLILFLILMAALTFFSRSLQEMTIANVQSTRPQRGALERRIQGEGTLAAGSETPVVISDAARVTQLFCRKGGVVQAGEALLALDYASIIKEKHEALVKAQDDLEAKQQAYDWASADVSGTTIDRMRKREDALTTALEALDSAQAAYDDALREQSRTQAAQDNAQAAYDSDATRANESTLNGAKSAHRQAGYVVTDTARQLERAEKDVEDARVDLDGFQKVRDYLTKQGELDTAKQTLADAEKAYREKLALLDDAPEGELPDYSADNAYIRTIAAPFNGTVQTLNAQNGATLDTNTPALTLSPSTGGLSVEVLVDGTQINDVRVDDTADLVIDGRITESIVTAITPSSSEEGKYNVRFDLPQDVGSAGQRATMYLRKRTQSYDVLIPLSALRSDASGDFVYTIQQSESSLGAQYSLSRVPVTVLEKDATRAAVTGGLSQSDLLATRGDRTLSDGDRVRLAGD